MLHRVFCPDAGRKSGKKRKFARLKHRANKLEKNQVLFIYDFLKKQSFRIGWNHSEFQSGC